MEGVSFRDGVFVLPFASHCRGEGAVSLTSPASRLLSAESFSHHTISCVSVALPSLKAGWYISSVLPPDLRRNVLPLPSSLTR